MHSVHPYTLCASKTGCRSYTLVGLRSLLGLRGLRCCKKDEPVHKHFADLEDLEDLPTGRQASKTSQTSQTYIFTSHPPAPPDVLLKIRHIAVRT